jgi:hypothetical protein
MITREDQVEQSVSDFVKDGLTTLDYVPNVVDVRDSFPTADERSKELRKTTVAVGFNFDDGGRHVELGSDLTLRIYTIEFWTFGTTPQQGRNIANVIRSLIEQSGYLVPLKAIELPDRPIFDQLIVSDQRGVAVTRQLARDPRTWDRFVWTTTVKIEDTYFPAAALVAD